MTKRINYNEVPLPMSYAWDRMIEAGNRMAAVQNVWRGHNRGTAEIPETWGDFGDVWTEYQNARAAETIAVDNYRRECRKAGYIGSKGRTKCPHLAS